MGSNLKKQDGVTKKLEPTTTGIIQRKEDESNFFNVWTIPVLQQARRMRAQVR